jgi:hypothetical protein
MVVRRRGSRGYPQSVSQRERRCPNCDALVGLGAEWCGQCFASLAVRTPAAEPPLAVVGEAAGSAVSERSAPSEPTWPCPACDAPNAMALDACRVCGTTFASLMRRDDRPPAVDPRDAFVRSLAFPGLGHRAVGRGGDGLARAVLFLMAIAIATVALLSGPTVPAVASVALLFGTLAIATYVGTAFEAARMARGRGAVLSSRAILWILVGLLMGSVLMLSLLVITAGPPASP